MNPIDLLRCLPPLVLSHGFIGLMLLVGVATGGLAQDKIPSALDRPSVEEVDEDEEPRRQNEPGMMNFAMDPDRWSEMAYSSLGGSKASFEQMQRRRVRRTLNRYELVCGISNELREKVQATADIEAQRLDLSIASLVADAPRKPTQQEYQDFYQRIWKEIQPYQQMHQAGDEAPNALWQKVLRGHLSDEQNAEIKADTTKRLALRQATQRLEVILNLSRLLGLNKKQRIALEAYSDSNPDSWSTFESAWSMLQSFPAEEKRKLFRPAQVDRLARPLETSNDIRPMLIMERE